MKEVYERKLNEVVTLIYSDQRKRSVSRGYDMPNYTKSELKKWIKSQPRFKEIWLAWFESGFKTMLKPSCDRLDDYVGYRFDNLQLVTFEENLRKPQLKNRAAIVGTCLSTGSVLKFDGICSAEDYFDMKGSGIGRVLRGERRSAFGRTWSYQ